MANWFEPIARAHGGFDVEVTDLAELGLPFLDEPNHPRLRRYTHAHTRAWSATVEASDAFVFVMPEYNFGMNAPLKNALDYLHSEWEHKPVGFVAYGGVAAGTRAVQMTKLVMSGLKLVPLFEAVYIPFVQEHDRRRGRAPGQRDHGEGGRRPCSTSWCAWRRRCALSGLLSACRPRRSTPGRRRAPSASA